MKVISQRNIPLSILLLFNLFTFLLFITAPYSWRNNNILLFIIFIITIYSSIIIGYQTGYKSGIKTVQHKNRIAYFSQRILSLIFTFYTFTFLIKYAYILRFEPYEIKKMISFLLVGIINPDLGYALTLDSSRAFTIPWSIYFLISIVNQLFFIIGFLSWPKLKLLHKTLYVIFLGSEIFFWMGRGTNFGVITLITTFLLTRLFDLNLNKTNLKNLLKITTTILLLLTLSLSIFSYNMKKRGGGNELNYEQFNLGESKVDESSIVFQIVPPPLHDTYMYMVYYLAQGYYHTSLSFDLDYKPTYFLGNNPAITELAKIIGIDVSKDTYVQRLAQKGVDPEIQWHSAYLWFASDVTFFGVPLLIYLLSSILGFSWAFSTNKNDLLSKIIFIICGNMIFFLFANNTYLASIFYSFMFILPYWLATRVLNFKLRAS